MSTSAPVTAPGSRNGRAMRRAHEFVSSLAFDPMLLVNKARALPHFVRNYLRYRSLDGHERAAPRLRDLHFTTHERYEQAGAPTGHYFHQDLWAARDLYERQVHAHVDVGSRLDGFIAHVLPFCRVTYVDIRPLAASIPNLEFRQGSIVELPFADGSVPSLSCLHVIEHIGLGRYGDPVDPAGDSRAARELARVLAPGGRLLLGTPVGRERICFDAHRVYDPVRIRTMFEPLRLARFALIDDSGTGVREDVSLEDARGCEYGCGLFVFEKVAP